MKACLKSLMSVKPTGSANRALLVKALPWLWLGMSAAWAVVIFTTDQLAWPLALWIATTLGPLTALKARLDSQAGPRGGAEHRPTSPTPKRETQR